MGSCSGAAGSPPASTSNARPSGNMTSGRVALPDVQEHDPQHAAEAAARTPSRVAACGPTTISRPKKAVSTGRAAREGARLQHQARDQASAT